MTQYQENFLALFYDTLFFKETDDQNVTSSNPGTGYEMDHFVKLYCLKKAKIIEKERRGRSKSIFQISIIARHNESFYQIKIANAN